jgi:hypothetical protein
MAAEVGITEPNSKDCSYFKYGVHDKLEFFFWLTRKVNPGDNLVQYSLLDEGFSRNQADSSLYLNSSSSPIKSVAI